MPKHFMNRIVKKIQFKFYHGVKYPKAITRRDNSKRIELARWWFFIKNNCHNIPDAMVNSMAI